MGNVNLNNNVQGEVPSNEGTCQALSRAGTVIFSNPHCEGSEHRARYFCKYHDEDFLETELTKDNALAFTINALNVEYTVALNREQLVKLAIQVKQALNALDEDLDA